VSALKSEWADQVFYVNEQGTITFLGAELKLLDAGDYDGEGRSAVIFKLQSYDKDGYVLFYDGFRRKASFTWIYH
jgi:hypothetical protein